MGLLVGFGCVITSSIVGQGTVVPSANVSPCLPVRIYGVHVDGSGRSRTRKAQSRLKGSSAKNEPTTVIDLAPSEPAHVEMAITMGTWRGGGRLITGDPGEAEPKVRKSKPMTDTKD
jgi:hypothetical protein